MCHSVLERRDEINNPVIRATIRIDQYATGLRATPPNRWAPVARIPAKTVKNKEIRSIHRGGTFCGPCHETGGLMLLLNVMEMRVKWNLRSSPRPGVKVRGPGYSLSLIHI